MSKKQDQSTNELLIDTNVSNCAYIDSAAEDDYGKMCDELPADKIMTTGYCHLVGFRSGYSLAMKKLETYISEIEEQCRINGMGSERELLLLAKIQRYEDTLNRIRTATETNEMCDCDSDVGFMCQDCCINKDCNETLNGSGDEK